jgi:hypothetical protein
VLRVLVGAAVLAASTGCALAPLALHGPPPADTRRFTEHILLHGTALDLHLAVPAAPVSDTVVLYATGDGGWFGTAVDMFYATAAHGYRTVGFSARAFLRIERPVHAPLSPRQLADDYLAILAAARTALGVPPVTPAILTGWSRGAAFAAIAASQPALRAGTRGVVAIGLAADEDLAMGDDDNDDGPGNDDAEASASMLAGPLRPYAHLHQLAPLRCAVIQAEHDDYLPAAEARALFGPETPERHFYAVPARNHRFAGGRDAFAAALTSALRWVDQT